MSCSHCGGKYYAGGFCRKHYMAVRRYGSPEGSKFALGRGLEARFWEKVDKDGCPGGCWAWLGGKSRNGYGVIQEGGRGSKNLSAHRVAYELVNGSIEEGRYILHSCDNRWCVNPAHLRAGTQSENIAEAYAKKRKVAPVFYGEAHPKSKLTADQVAYIRSHPEMKHTELASMFGLSPNCIRGVRIGRTWSKLVD